METTNAVHELFVAVVSMYSQYLRHLCVFGNLILEEFGTVCIGNLSIPARKMKRAGRQVGHFGQGGHILGHFGQGRAHLSESKLCNCEKVTILLSPIIVQVKTVSENWQLYYTN